MKRNTNEIEGTIDRLLNDIRQTELDQAKVEEVGSRVWSVLATTSEQPELSEAGSIHGCQDFQSLMPAYIRGELSDARTLLFRDHTSECIPCRRALKNQQKSSKVTSFRVETKKRNPPSWSRPAIRWAIAACLILGLGLVGLPVLRRLLPFGNQLDATVLAADGEVFVVDGTRNRVLQSGAKISRGETIRTARDGRAMLRLGDGSTIEVKDRSELSIDRNGPETTIHIDRGNVIVQAAEQKSEKLFVATNDALVGVKGTIFAVNSGTKGSRISVVKGQVSLDHAGTQSVIDAGQQATTNPALERVPLQQELNWSRNSQEYTGLLNQVEGLRKDLVDVAKPGVRYSTRLLDAMPDNTVLYASVPNFAESVVNSNRIIQEQISKNPALHDWWEKHDGGPARQAELNGILDKISQFGKVLGDEVAVGAELDAEGKPSSPVVVATLKDAESFRQLLTEQLKSAKPEAGKSVVFVDDLNQKLDDQGKDTNTIFVWIQNDVMVASPRLGQLQGVAVRLQSGTGGAFLGTSFHGKVADVYKSGAGILVAADLKRIIEAELSRASQDAKNENRIEGLKQLGLTKLDYFVAEQKEVGSKTLTQAVLGFEPSTQGITSWLASPGPMGGLDYISPDANIVAAFVVKEPTGLVDDLLKFVETASPDFGQHLQKVETEHGINLRKDIAGPLGGEFAFAIDGPILPTPSWKMVFEVNDPAKLQSSLEHIVEEVNRETAKSGFSGLQWENEDLNGFSFHKLRSPQFGLEVNFVYANGYLIAGPSRAVVESALRFHDSGVTLRTSKRFGSSLPADGNANFSAIIYHDLAPLIAPLAQKFGDSAPEASEKQKAIAALAANTPPTLAYAYAQGDRITIASTNEGGPFGLNPTTLLGMPNALDLQHILWSGMRGKENRQP